MNDLHITYTYNTILPNIYIYSSYYQDNALMINMKLWKLVVKEGLSYAVSQTTGNTPSESLIEAIIAIGEGLEEEKDVTVVFGME